MAETEVEMEITVGEGKYTFFIFKGDYRIHCWRYNEPWMIFTKGHKAISNLMYDYEKLVKLLKDALPHIECKNNSQSGLITEIGEYLEQALKEKP